MSLRINTNVAALNAYNNLSANQMKLEQSFQQLSSGLRINRAADDASGLAISQNLTSQINGMTQAVSNANDAINVTQVADGGLATVQDVLQRMRTLVVQAGNAGSQDTTSLTAIQNEVKALNGQLDAIGTETKYGGKSLLDGSYNTQFQVGAGGGDSVSLNLSSVNINSAQLGAAASGGNNLNALNIATIDFTQAGAAYTNGSATSGTNTADDLSAIDAAISTVSSARATIGAAQNQLSYTVTNLQTAITNVTASRSNLTDADLATQVTKMTQQQILTSAATSVLAQANSAPQAILKLLQ
jgi:flagellin